MQMFSFLNDSYSLTNHILKFKEDLMVNYLTIKPPLIL